MNHLLILVEGQTEETFVREVLNDYFAGKNIFLTPVLATTKRVRSGKNFRGGITSYDRVHYDIQRLLGDTSVQGVTTMLDYYGLPANFPGMSDRPRGDCYVRVAHVERAFANQVNDRRFFPFLMLHEYEALLFSGPEAARDYFIDSKIVPAMQQIRLGFASPEEINEGRQSHPSHRLMQIAPSYQKTLHGPLLALEMGLTTIRKACPHFDAWITQIEEIF